MKKSIAKLLVRRLLAVYVSKSLIRMVSVRTTGLPAEIQRAKVADWKYDHHIEPRLETLTPLEIQVSYEYLQGL